MLNKYFWAASLWTVIIAVSCLVAGNELGVIQLVKIPYKDKAFHFTFYFVFTLLWVLTFRLVSSNYKKVRLWVFVSAIFYGIVIEILQWAYAEGRSAEVADALANTAGSATAIGLIWIVGKSRK